MVDSNLKGKRLLLLGGGMWKDCVAQYAKSQGITLVATGNSASSGIFEIADETYLVDSTDSVAMKKLILEHNIDGVYMGGSEPVINAASQYLNELNYPCYCTKEQWDFLQNKANFKELCNKHGLPTVPRFFVTESDLNNGADVCYPVITKPADGCGSNGFSVCHNDRELKAGYQIAKEASPTGSVLVEKFVDNTSIVVFYTFADGEMIFSGIEDKYTAYYNEQGRYVAGALIFESGCTQEFREKFDDKLKNMFTDINIREGSLWVEVFYNGEDFYFNEVGYRYGGSVSVYPVDYFYNINQVAIDIKYALLGKQDVNNIHNTPHLIRDGIVRKSKYCVYPVQLRPGEIASIEGVEELRKNNTVVAIPTTKQLGDVVVSSGTVSQVYAFVHFVFDTKEELNAMIDKIHRVLVVRDTDGNNMVHRMIDTESLNRS